MSKALVGKGVSHYESDTYMDPFIHALRRATQVEDARSGRGFLEETKRPRRGGVVFVENLIKRP